MYKKSVFKVAVIFVLVVTTFLFGSFGASAYRPLIDIQPSDWTVRTEDTFSSVYPSSPSSWSGNDSVFNYHDLDGSTYFYSTHWNDDFTKSEEHTVTFPAFPSTVNQNCQVMLLRSGDLFYLFVTEEPSYFKFLLDSQSYPGYYTEIECMYYVYVFGAASSDWALLYSDFAIDLYTVLTFTSNYVPYDSDSYSVIWSNCNIYRYTSKDGIGDSVHSPDSFVLQDRTFTFSFEKQMSVLAGGLSFDLSAYQMKRFVAGAYCVRIDDMGIICGTTTTVVQYWYMFSIFSGGKNLGTYKCTDKAFEDFGVTADNCLDVGDKCFKDLLCISDFDFDVDSSADYTVQFQMVFVSNGHNLVFPGRLEVIEFEAYEDDMKHDEIKDAIQNASDTVSGSINSAKSELSQEIVKASTDIQTAVNDSAADIVQSVDNASSQINQKLDDVKNSVDDVKDTVNDVGDKITDKIEDSKNSLLDGIKNFFIPNEETLTNIKSDWDELLQLRFGALYQVGDIISDFAKSLTYQGVKNTIDFPEVSVHLVDTDFTFGGYEVQVVPEGFETVINILKKIISIVCTLLFINALKHKFDKLIGGSSE